jgi:hypothetical protein
MFANTAARRAPCALVTLLALLVAATAQPARAQQTPSAASILIAREIVELKGVRGMFDPVVRGVVEKAKAMFMQTNFMLAKELNEVAAGIHRDFDSRSAELVDQTARFYASHFTEAELKELAKFYRSPIGKKVIEQEPKAVEQSMNFAARWADNLSNDVIARIRAEMKKRGHDL